MVDALTDRDPSLLDAVIIVQHLQTSPREGLATKEATRRRIAFGANDIATVPRTPTWRRFVTQFRSPLIYLLFAALVASVAVWVAEGAQGWPVDGLVIAAIVVLNATLGYMQQAHAERAVDALARITAATATVVRDGVQQRVPATELVPGDVVVLNEGDTVAADARLLSAKSLETSEASLTGHSEPVAKDARTLGEPAALGDRLNMVFKGTAVTKGSGRAVVTATAMATQMGQIAGLVRAVDRDATPLQREIAWAGRVLGAAVLAIAVVVIITIFVVFGVHSAGDVVTAVLLGVSLAVAAVPEGLPAIMSVVLALGMRRMANHNAIVKELASVETLGSASVVCSGKTGTLTTGEMTIARVVTPMGEVSVTGTGYRPEGRLEHDGVPLEEGGDLWRQTALVLGGGSVGGDATLQEQDGQWTVLGDPIEGAFLVADMKTGTRSRWTTRFQRPGEARSSSQKDLTTVASDGDLSGTFAVVTKGDPSAVLDDCAYVQIGDRLQPLDDSMRATILDHAERLSHDALHPVAVAYRPLDVATPPMLDDCQGRESPEDTSVYAGMVGITDPPRPEAARPSVPPAVPGFASS